MPGPFPQSGSYNYPSHVRADPRSCPRRGGDEPLLFRQTLPATQPVIVCMWESLFIGSASLTVTYLLKFDRQTADQCLIFFLFLK